MSNMTYCQFENTAIDLRQCAEWLHENDPDQLSESELRCFKHLVKLSKEIVENYGEDYAK